jgi:MFS family permease
MDQVARGWLVLQLTHSPFHLGMMAFVNGISSLVSSPVAGLLSDQLDRRFLATLTQLLAALIAVIIGLLVAFDQIALWQLYVTAGLNGVIQSVNMPARQVLVYDVVGPGYLTNAIALNSVTANIARIGAPSVGGGIIAAVDIEATYYAEAAFFLLATAATFMLRPITVAAPVRVPLWQGLRQGFDYVRRDPVLTRLVALNVVPNLLIYPYVSMFPIFADEVLNVGSTGYGVLLSGVGFGSIPGGLIVASMTGSRRKGRTMGVATLLYMGMVAAFAGSQWFGLSFALLVVAGVGWSMMAILNQTLMQLQLTDDAVRGRVLAFYSMAGGLTPFGALAMGSTADGIGVQWAVAAFALTGLVLAAYVGLGSARVRAL